MWKLDDYDCDTLAAALCKKCGVSPKEYSKLCSDLKEHRLKTANDILLVKTKGELITKLEQYNTLPGRLNGEIVHIKYVLNALGMGY